MIALRDNLPLIRLERGECLAYEGAWLARSLASAARKAGYGQWWLAEHVTASVTEYLRTQNEAMVIDAAKLRHSVECVLQAIGYGEVARHFDLGRPAVSISLVELARAACASGYELAFFENLARRLAEAVETGAPHVEVVGLEASVKILRAQKIWSRACNALKEEIVAFAREQTGHAASPAHDLTFALA